MTLKIVQYSDSFAENKDVARELREKYIIPTYRDSTEEIVLDFGGIDSSTQSFIHALISQLLQDYGEAVLKRVFFKKCNRAVKSLVGTVVNYSLE
jgi:STAS-like domain of unknown function (DUF4325)